MDNKNQETEDSDNIKNGDQVIGSDKNPQDYYALQPVIAGKASALEDKIKLQTVKPKRIGKKFLVVVLAIIVVVIAGGGVTAYYYLNQSASTNDNSAESSNKSDEIVDSSQPSDEKDSSADDSLGSTSSDSTQQSDPVVTNLNDAVVDSSDSTKMVVSDQTFDTGYTMSFPYDWKLKHTREETDSVATADESVITSPSGDILINMNLYTDIKMISNSFCEGDKSPIYSLEVLGFSNLLDYDLVTFTKGRESSDLYFASIMQSKTATKNLKVGDLPCNLYYGGSNIKDVPLLPSDGSVAVENGFVRSLYFNLSITSVSMNKITDAGSNITQPDINEITSSAEFKTAQDVIRSVYIKK